MDGDGYLKGMADSWLRSPVGWPEGLGARLRGVETAGWLGGGD